MNVHRTTRNAFYYKFFLTKAEEEEEAQAPQKKNTRRPIVVEIRDDHPLPMVDRYDPWRIKKTLNHDELSTGILFLSFNDVYDYVMRYWQHDMACLLVYGQKMGVIVVDVTEDGNPRVYGRRNDVFLQFLQIEDWDCVLVCADLMKDRRLKAGDTICLYWDGRGFIFKCFRHGVLNTRHS